MHINIYNFGAGPATLPKTVIEKITAQLDNFTDGMSIMEISHRSKAFKDFASHSEKNLRSLLKIDDNYAVLFLQGGATQQFSMVPMNLANQDTVDYLITGAWSKKAILESNKIGKTVILASSKDKQYTYIPKDIFIEHKIYRKIEDCNTWDAVLKTVKLGLKPFEINCF